jgi:hypothetical protein
LLVVKVVDDRVVVDIRVVWDGSANGHNDTLWQPGFSLPGFGEAADLVVKWLPMTIGEYLDQGSPEVDYRRAPSSFIKSYLGDVDVGGMYNIITTTSIP